jgi:hypothetical protein
MGAVGAGCSAATDGGAPRSQASQPSAPIPSDPVEAFAAAKARLGTESARFARDTSSDALDFTGVVDADTKNWEISGKEYVLRRVGSDLYARVSGNTLKSLRDNLLARPATIDRLAAGGWLRSRLPQFRETSPILSDEFPWNMAGPAARATAITPTGDRSFSGTLPLGESANGSRPNIGELRVNVDLDDRGRFTRIAIKANKKPDASVLFTFSDFGVHADITVPPTEGVAVEENTMYLLGIGIS